MKSELLQMIHDCTIEFSDIENRINSLPATDKGKLYLTNYALIRACGTAEYVMKSLIADYFLKYNSSQLDVFMEQSIRNAPDSAKYDNMCKLLKRFDDVWASSFKNAVSTHQNSITHSNDSQKLIASSNSLVNNRHSFAHGKMPTASFANIKMYFEDVIELIKIMDSVIV